MQVSLYPGVQAVDMLHHRRSSQGLILREVVLQGGIPSFDFSPYSNVCAGQGILKLSLCELVTVIWQ